VTDQTVLNAVRPYLTLKYEGRVHNWEAGTVAYLRPSTETVMGFNMQNVSTLGSTWSEQVVELQADFQDPWDGRYFGVNMWRSGGFAQGDKTIDLRQLRLEIKEADREAINTALADAGSDLTFDDLIDYDKTSAYSENTYSDYSLVNVSASAGGDVSVSAARAKSGDLVTITKYVNIGYKLSEITVKKESGDTVSTTEEDGVVTFTMPDEPVTVQATFADAGTHNRITLDENIDNGSLSVESLFVAHGETVIVTATPETGYMVDTITALADGTELTMTRMSSLAYSFVMPDKDVEVTATFKEVPKRDFALLWYTEPGTETVNPYFNGTSSYPYQWKVVSAEEQSAYQFTVTKNEGRATVYGRKNQNVRFSHYLDTAEVTLNLKLETSGSRTVTIGASGSSKSTTIEVSENWEQYTIPFSEIAEKEISYITISLDERDVDDILYVGEITIWSHPMEDTDQSERFEKILEISEKTGYEKSETNTLLGVIGAVLENIFYQRAVSENAIVCSD
jgi:hypothetical protein